MSSKGIKLYYCKGCHAKHPWGIHRIRQRKSNVKKTGGRKKKNSEYSIRIRGPTVVPDSIFIKMRFTSLGISMTSTSAPAVEQFSLNDINVPFISGSGHKPLGYDQWSNFYKSWRVHASKIVVETVNLPATGFISIFPTPTTTVLATLTMASSIEQPYARHYTIASASLNPKIKQYMSTKKIFGYKSIQYEDDFVGTISTSPVNIGTWLIFQVGYNLSSSTTFTYNFFMTYYVEFFNRIQLAIST